MKTRGRAPETKIRKGDNDESVTPVEAAAGIVQAATQDVELVLEEVKDAAHAALKKIRKAVPGAARKRRFARAAKPAVKKSAKATSKKTAPRKGARRKRRS